MSVKIEFNPDLSLRKYGTKNRKRDECLPVKLKIGETYDFQKNGQRNYWLEGEIPLYRTDGSGALEPALAMVRIVEETHCIRDGQIITRGKYEITKVLRRKR